MALAAVAAVAATACVDRSLPQADESRVVVGSPVWQQGVSAREYRDRIAALTRAVERLREETGSGWFGRQDDVTGYLAELSGGRFAGRGSGGAEGAAAGLLDSFGDELFGVRAGDVSFVSSEPLGNGGVVIRAEQRVGDVPVLDARLLVTVADAEGTPRVNAVRGRVFPDAAEVSTEPAISAEDAALAARRASGGTVQGDPRLVVIPLAGQGTLAWEITVAGEVQGTTELGVGVYYVDAQGGQVLVVRPGAADVGVPLPGLVGAARGTGARAAALLQQAGAGCGDSGQSVPITGTGPLGEPLEGFGVLQGDGRVALVDTTTPTFDGATGGGGVCTHDASGVSQEGLPGPLVTSAGQAIGDAEGMAAHAFSRFIYDYYLLVHGRRSWDGQGATLVSSVHFGDEGFCNSFFSSSLDPPQMVYGSPCGGTADPQEKTEVDIDTAAHEITHGVTDTSSDLMYVGPSGALNESFSDYFGNLIGDRLLGRDSNAAFEGSCTGIEPPTALCTRNPDGTVSLRYMLNGSTLADYAYLLSPPLYLRILGYTQDNGGVHLNSAIWNNALWTIRLRLAAIDGTPAIESALVEQFDRVVYGALTRYLTPTSGFLDARAAIEAAATEIEADATVHRVIRQVFDENLICAGCTDPPAAPGIPVATTAASQLSPVVSGSRVAWVDLSLGQGITGLAAVGAPRESAAPVTGRPDAFSIGFAGDLVVTAENPGNVVVYDVQARTARVVDRGISDGVIAGIAGSDEGAAWIDFGESALKYVDAEREVRSNAYPSGDAPLVIGAGGGTVVTGGEQGTIVVWQPGSDARVLAEVEAPVWAVDAHGDRVAVVHGGGPLSVTLFDLSSGESRTLSGRAGPFGITVSDRYVVWAQVIGELGGRVSAEHGGLPDTDLYLHSLATGTTYVALRQRGQQGFPYLSGNRIVWQDGVLGGDDVFLADVPGGL